MFEKIFKKKPLKVVIVQCRMSSTRLPGKALLPLGGKTVLEWCLSAMKKVKADKYFLAVDTQSEQQLAPVAKCMGWDFFAGSQKDVLKRFCDVIELSGADIVLRATADNPFLFYEAAQNLLNDFSEIYQEQNVDYMTYTELPHGSGVEVFNAHSLLKAATLTDLPYDHEHVGPALYNHKDKFKCLFVKPEHEFRHPELRTTIDTLFDYLRAEAVCDSVMQDGPYSCQQILNACAENYIKNPVLLIPSVKKGQGTGHLRRCLDIAVKNKFHVYIPANADLAETNSLVRDAKAMGLKNYQITETLDFISDYKLVITDLFKTPKIMQEKLAKAKSVCALDEGNENLDYADFVLDVIPSSEIKRKANAVMPELISLPENIRENPPEKIKNVLVCFGGEDPAGFTIPVVKNLSGKGLKITAVFSDCASLEDVVFVPEILNLKNELYNFDLVITHYGFTAFEARAAGTYVLLFAPTELHKKLSVSQGFECIELSDFTENKINEILENPEILACKKYDTDKDTKKDIGSYLDFMSRARKFNCPVCGSHFEKDLVVARCTDRTYRKCSLCGITYLSYTFQEEETVYNHDYFFSDYEKQYGKTYLQDFDSIKKQGLRRMENIQSVLKKTHRRSPCILDVGCAMGPFLSAADASGWQCFGTDVSAEAVEYVSKSMNFPAVCGAFPDVELLDEFGIEKFDAVSMWFVIEHFKDLDSVLKAVSNLLDEGGVFAFSTPSGAGVSARFSQSQFFDQSPLDHYSIWDPRSAKNVLKKYGFKVVKTVSTGIHPERFPAAKKHGWTEKDIRFSVLKSVSSAMSLGDTFEVYCRKIKG